MVEVTEEVGDAPIVDVATDHDKLLLVVHLHRHFFEAGKWSSFHRMLVNWFFYFFLKNQLVGPLLLINKQSTGPLELLNPWQTFNSSPFAPPCRLRHTSVCCPQSLQSRGWSLQTLRFQLGKESRLEQDTNVRDTIKMKSHCWGKISQRVCRRRSQGRSLHSQLWKLWSPSTRGRRQTGTHPR